METNEQRTIPAEDAQSAPRAMPTRFGHAKHQPEPRPAEPEGADRRRADELAFEDDGGL